MIIPTLVVFVLVVVAVYVAVGKGVALTPAVVSASRLALSILPLLFLAFVLAALLPSILPAERIGGWIGPASGFRGVVLGTLAGCLTPGGPFVSFPLVVVLMKAGAGVGTLVAFITAWGTLGLNRLPIEIGIVGWRFTALRYAVSFFLPLVAGSLARLFFRTTDFTP